MPFLVAIVAALSFLISCSPRVDRSEANIAGSAEPDRGDDEVADTPPRYLLVEVDNPTVGLPCRVVDRPNPETRNVLWRAEFEVGFCREKALESRAILESQGWACRPLKTQEQREDRYLDPTGEATGRHLAAVWRCLGGLAPNSTANAAQPVVPLARPSDLQAQRPSITRARSSAPGHTDTALINAVEGDLKAIGQDAIGGETKVETAHGDLNGDGSDDAVVVLTRSANRNQPHRMLMAYLESDETYNLVDVLVLKLAAHASNAELGLRIENGNIRIGACCEDTEAPTILTLDDRKLSYVDRVGE
jgi:hypothetical protein